MSSYIRVPSSDFPSDVLKWMKTNAKPKSAIKLMKCHKFFQHREFPYFVLKRYECFKGEDDLHDEWHYQTLDGQYYGPSMLILGIQNNRSKMKDIFNISKLLWITENLVLSGSTVLSSVIIQKIAVCEIKVLCLSNQKLSLNEFKILCLANTINSFGFHDSSIYSENGNSFSMPEVFKNLLNLKTFGCSNGITPIYIDSILECVPNLEEIYYNCEDSAIFSPDFCINSLKNIGIPSKLKKLDFCPRKYIHFKSLSKLMKEFPHIRYSIDFEENPLSDDEIQKLEKYIQCIIDTGITKYPPPHFSFDGQKDKQFDAMLSLIECFDEKYNHDC